MSLLGVIFSYGTPSDLLRFGVFNNELRSVNVALMRGAYADTRLFGIPVLIYAAQHGYLDVIKSLLEYDIDLDIRGDQLQTALIEAVKMGHNATAELLLMTEINIHVRNQQGLTALDYAFIAENSTLIEHIICAGFEVHIAFHGTEIAQAYGSIMADFQKKKRAYLKYLNSRDQRSLEMLLGEFPYLAQVRDALGETILHKGVRWDHSGLCEKLLKINPYLGRFKNSQGYAPAEINFLESFFLHCDWINQD